MKIIEKAAGILFLALVFTLPLMRFPQISILNYKVQLSDFIAFILLLITVFIWCKKRQFPDLSYWLASLAIVLPMLLALLGSDSFLKAFFEVVIQIYLLFILIITVYWLESKVVYEKIFGVWAFSGVLVIICGIFGIGLYYAGFENNPFIAGYGLDLPSGHYPRLSSTLMSAGYLAHYLIPTFFIFYFWAKKSQKYKVLWIILLILLFIVDFFSLERSFFLCFVAFGFWKAHIAKNRFKKAFSLILSSLLLIFVLFSCFYSPKFSHFVQALKGKEIEPKFMFFFKPTPRQIIWKSALEQIKNNPFWGRGLDKYATGPLKIGSCKICNFPEGVDGHNIFLNLWSTRGVLGLIGYIFFLGWIIKRSAKFSLKPSSPVELQLMFWAVVGMLLASLFLDIEDFRHLYLCLGILAGMTERLIKSSSNSSLDYFI